MLDLLILFIDGVQAPGPRGWAFPPTMVLYCSSGLHLEFIVC